MRCSSHKVILLVIVDVQLPGAASLSPTFFPDLPLRGGDRGNTSKHSGPCCGIRGPSDSAAGLQERKGVYLGAVSQAGIVLPTSL